MLSVASITEVKELIDSSQMALLYFSGPNCGVCTAMRPKIERMLEGFPDIRSAYIDTSAIPETSGEFSIFTIPAVLFFIQGKETLREARYFSVEALEERIERYYRLLSE